MPLCSTPTMDIRREFFWIGVDPRLEAQGWGRVGLEIERDWCTTVLGRRRRLLQVDEAQPIPHSEEAVATKAMKNTKEMKAMKSHKISKAMQAVKKEEKQAMKMPAGFMTTKAMKTLKAMNAMKAMKETKTAKSQRR